MQAAAAWCGCGRGGGVADEGRKRAARGERRAAWVGRGWRRGEEGRWAWPRGAWAWGGGMSDEVKEHGPLDLSE